MYIFMIRFFVDEYVACIQSAGAECREDASAALGPLWGWPLPRPPTAGVQREALCVEAYTL